MPLWTNWRHGSRCRGSKHGRVDGHLVLVAVLLAGIREGIIMRLTYGIPIRPLAAHYRHLIRLLSQIKVLML